MTPEGPRFKVQGIGRFPQQFDRLILSAEQRNLRSLLMEALRTILEHLETQPREWGDPYTNFRAMHAVAYGRTVVSAGLRIEYTVHESERFVWITAIWPLPGSPLAERVNRPQE